MATMEEAAASDPIAKHMAMTDRSATPPARRQDEVPQEPVMPALENLPGVGTPCRQTVRLACVGALLITCNCLSGTCCIRLARGLLWCTMPPIQPSLSALPIAECGPAEMDTARAHTHSTTRLLVLCPKRSGKVECAKCHLLLGTVSGLTTFSVCVAMCPLVGQADEFVLYFVCINGRIILAAHFPGFGPPQQCGDCWTRLVWLPPFK